MKCEGRVSQSDSFGTQWWGKQPLLSYSVPFRRVLSSQIIVSQ
jgi:hypothetical protein